MCACACTVGPSVSGYDDTPGDNPPADAADPPAAGPEPPAAPGAPAAATGPHVTAGTTHTTHHHPHYQQSATNSNAHGRFHIYSTIQLTSVEPLYATAHQSVCVQPERATHLRTRFRCVGLRDEPPLRLSSHVFAAATPRVLQEAAGTAPPPANPTAACRQAE